MAALAGVSPSSAASGQASGLGDSVVGAVCEFEPSLAADSVQGLMHGLREEQRLRHASVLRLAGEVEEERRLREQAQRKEAEARALLETELLRRFDGAKMNAIQLEAGKYELDRRLRQCEEELARGRYLAGQSLSSCSQDGATRLQRCEEVLAQVQAEMQNFDDRSREDAASVQLTGVQMRQLREEHVKPLAGSVSKLEARLDALLRNTFSAGPEGRMDDDELLNGASEVAAVSKVEEVTRVLQSDVARLEDKLSAMEAYVVRLDVRISGAATEQMKCARVDMARFEEQQKATIMDIARLEARLDGELAHGAREAVLLRKQGEESLKQLEKSAAAARERLREELEASATIERQRMCEELEASATIERQRMCEELEASATIERQRMCEELRTHIQEAVHNGVPSSSAEASLLLQRSPAALKTETTPPSTPRSHRQGLHSQSSPQLLLQGLHSQSSPQLLLQDVEGQQPSVPRTSKEAALPISKKPTVGYGQCGSTLSPRGGSASCLPGLPPPATRPPRAGLDRGQQFCAPTPPRSPRSSPRSALGSPASVFDNGAVCEATHVAEEEMSFADLEKSIARIMDKTVSSRLLRSTNTSSARSLFSTMKTDRLDGTASSSGCTFR
eukprot:TRINITY_DN5516_c0_g1_i4.p1 TRINITY_DN5516_c0_g1~~TRINITY_DN5516_c0_g1_i4.p1  ORF type:complete len:620 (-),score=154.87 TRINITY_DN5516_c0_g1_i4:205-2064(-)